MPARRAGHEFRQGCLCVDFVQIRYWDLVQSWQRGHSSSCGDLVFRRELAGRKELGSVLSEVVSVPSQIVPHGCIDTLCLWVESCGEALGDT